MCVCVRAGLPSNAALRPCDRRVRIEYLHKWYIEAVLSPSARDWFPFPSFLPNSQNNATSFCESLVRRGSTFSPRKDSPISLSSARAALAAFALSFLVVASWSPGRCCRLLHAVVHPRATVGHWQGCQPLTQGNARVHLCWHIGCGGKPNCSAELHLLVSRHTYTINGEA